MAAAWERAKDVRRLGAHLVAASVMPAAPAPVGLVLTAVPQSPAAAEAREALLKAIAGEADSIAKAKD
ncbi:hypothetical protein [Streptomyces goshikiensis]